MKKIISVAVMLLWAALITGCGPVNKDTLAKDIIDQWHLV